MSLVSNPIFRYFEMLIIYRPFLLDSQEAMYKIEKQLGDLIGIEAIVQA